MAAPKLIAAKCPTCGANLPVPPGMVDVRCRYCQNVIHVEHRKPPPHVHPFGTPGGMPSTTLYIDPDEAAKAGKRVGLLILVSVLLPLLIPLGIGVGPWAVRSCKGAIKPFPASCSLNEELTLSGNFETTGPLITSTQTNCKLTIKNSKLKASKLFDTNASNIVLTLENVTIETTDTMVKGGSNLKVKILGSTLTSTGGSVFDTESNMDLQEVVGSTLESKTDVAIRSKSNLKVRADNAKIRGKKGAIVASSSFELTMKNGSELVASDGPAISADSNFRLDAKGGKIEGTDGAIVGDSSMTITAAGLVITSKDAAIKTSSNLKLDYDDGSITSLNEAAIEAQSSIQIDLSNTKVSGGPIAISSTSGLKLKASKKTRIVATSGVGLATSSSCDMNITDASVEAATTAIKGGVSCKVRLGQGARIAGKGGGIDMDSSAEIDGTGATIEGGTGPGVRINSSGGKISLRQGVLKGTPAIETKYKPSLLELAGTRVEGEQRIPAR